MQNLEKRISLLEQIEPRRIGPIFIHIVGLGAKANEIERVTSGNREWKREPFESEKSLKDRAVNQVQPPKAGCSNVFLCY
ncbi:hypothetical protein [Rhodoferax sp. GW822-FHT02A01]|uniref:hypothetical protein n=1 Tax=Rhodoferax sp. GW822-FHT02A01 TaxID=3141537 RepID=UPI00315CB9FB